MAWGGLQARFFYFRSDNIVICGSVLILMGKNKVKATWLQEQARRALTVGERLQKYLAKAGIASRRRAEELIVHGEILVNGQPAALGTQVEAGSDVVTFRGQVVRLEQEKSYLMLNKPTGVVTTVYDPQGRRTVLDLLPPGDKRLYPVGRLDLDTSGLLLVTNDGDFAYALTHPKFKVQKTYRAWVRGLPDEKALRRVQLGIELEDGMTAPAEVQIQEQRSGQTCLELTIHEGKKRQVRRMCAALGFPVLSLARVRFGSLMLGDLPAGQTRQLLPSEVLELLSLSGVE